MSTTSINEFDELQLYFGEDYKINSKIGVSHPTVGKIIEMGEGNYFKMIQSLTCIPSNMKSMLWDCGIDYEEISDFELFCMLAPSLSSTETNILFSDAIDFSKMKLYKDTVDGRSILADLDADIQIDEYVYLKLVTYLRKIHAINPKIEKAGTKNTKIVMLELDRQDRLKAQSKQFESTLLPLISSLLNTPGFKYRKDELKSMHYYEFLDSVRRIRVLKHADALLQGIYCGNVDGKKINKKELDGFRDLSTEA